MHKRRFYGLAVCMILASSSFLADELAPVRDLGNKALHAFRQQQDEDGRRYFEDFLQKVKTSTAAQRNQEIQLMMGIMGCALPEYKKLGRVALSRFLQTGKDVRERRALEALLNACSGPDAVMQPTAATLDPVLAFASGGPGPRVTGTGKGGATFRSSVVASVAVSPIDLAELEKRMKETNDPATALAPTLARFGSGAQGKVTDHFIVATEGGEKRADGIGSCLDSYVAELQKEFDMVFPSHRITVYNISSPDKVYRVAGSLHGLELSPGTIAYSVYADLSMVGAGSPEGCGSLAHELTHLMIRENFGDGPAWLEEGLASAVALSTPEGDHLDFQPGWRDDVLRHFWNVRPTVEQLLKLTWADFSPADFEEVKKSAAVHAMASVFVRYLASKNKLRDVYFAVRKQDVIADIDHYRSTQQILEKEMGRSVAEVDQDFVAWFGQQLSSGDQP